MADSPEGWASWYLPHAGFVIAVWGPLIEALEACHLALYGWAIGVLRLRPGEEP